MIKLTNIHWNYLFNKINVTIIVILELVGVMIALVGINEINSEYNGYVREQSIIIYLDYYKLYYKLIIVLFSCYLWGSSFTKENDSYHLLVTDYYHKRLLYVVSKILILMVVSFLIIYLLFFNYAIVGIICSNWFEVSKKVLELFVSSYLIVIIYGLLAAILVRIIPSDYAYMLSLMAFVFGEIIKEDYVESSFNLYYFICPIILEANVTVYGILHLICLCLIYLFWLIFLFVKNKRVKK